MPIIISDRTIISDFVRKVEEISGENFSKCMQCGTCSGSCPMMENMTFGPRMMILRANFGQEEQVIGDNTAWICASCHSCMVRCPRGIDIAKLMEAIRQISLRMNENYVEPFKIDEEILEELPPIAMVSCFRKHTA
ncbi:heterodisulfide reductase [candidate division LCP-89 bacterium B3_LCP]|uniref:Heterodisulfide reductase n=1 Tax=candidate division LCP-89 bacterium B3_LCP TaxID=2012998 RepID=A0A532V1K9_UNCL8|nr:MAG: heterodisulfide reductase [candidate division LCP-89 bacterium B3_LCP]